MSCWSVCLSVCYTYNFVWLHICINIFMYIRNISRHDFLLKVVTKKLWKILQEKNIVKAGKKIGVKKKKWKKRKKFHSSLFLTPNIFFRSRLVRKEFSGPEKNVDRFSSPSFLFCPSDNPNIGKNFFPFFSLGLTQKSI